MNTPVIVAEMSANHLGSLARALDIVDAAAEAGADCIKVQTWTPGTMCVDPTYTLDHGPWAGKRLVDLYEEAFLPWEWHKPIFDKARARGLIPFSAAFDCAAVDFLETLGVDRHKVASFELTDLPLIRHMASKGRPMILSTGMAAKYEIVAASISAGSNHQTILKCTSSYPAPVESMNLLTMPVWKRPGRDVGLSDHSMGNEAAIVATALGATMLEKHLTLSRAGPDAGFSLEPGEFKALVHAVRNAAASLGAVRFGLQPGEDASLRRSLWVTRPMKKGERFILGHNVVSARPASGLEPDCGLDDWRASRDLQAIAPLQAEDLA